MENETERKDEGELTPEELQEKSDEAREAMAENGVRNLEAEAMRDVAHAIGVHKLIMSAFK